MFNNCSLSAVASYWFLRLSYLIQVSIPLGETMTSKGDTQRSEIGRLVRFRMRTLQLPEQDYNGEGLYTQSLLQFIH